VVPGPGVLRDRDGGACEAVLFDSSGQLQRSTPLFCNRREGARPEYMEDSSVGLYKTVALPLSYTGV
jgi:hypothetical protein